MRELLAVLVGGMLGTGLRLLVDVLLPHDATGFPVGTLLVNVVGAFVLGLLVSLAWPRVPAWLRAGLGAGFLGSFTTFSAVMVSLVAQADAGVWALAVGYLLASLVLGFAAAALGLRLGRRPLARPAATIDWVDE
jgi:CrcB protein